MDERKELCLRACEGLSDKALEAGVVGRGMHILQTIARDGALSPEMLVFIRSLDAEFKGLD